MLRITACILYLLLVQFLFGQNRNNHTSGNIQDTVKVQELNFEAIELTKRGSEQGVIYARKALKLAHEIKFTSGEIQALVSISRHYVTVEENLDSALYYLKLAQQKSNSQKDTKIQADIFRKMGTLYMYKGNSDSALIYLNNALSLFEKIHDSVEVIRVVNNIGFAYFNKEEYEKAIKYFFKSLRFNEAQNDSVFLSNDYNNVASVLQNQKDYASARDYFG